MTVDAKYELLRHFLAALAYRTAKVVRGAPGDFARFDAGYGVRKPVEILAHMSAVLRHAVSFFSRQQGGPVAVGAWREEIQRFGAALTELDGLLAAGAELRGRTEEQILQGPLADAMTHVGQLAMLRRMAGAPIRKESFDEAAIRLGDLSLPNS